MDYFRERMLRDLKIDSIVLAMALGRVKQNNLKLIRSLVKNCIIKIDTCKLKQIKKRGVSISK